jgi:CO/xanthine dehydrogenase Mo-binding subunit
LPGHAVGRGAASAFWSNGSGTSSAKACLLPDGAIQLVMGSVDLAAIRLVVGMQLAETLAVPVTAIRTVVGDTGSVGYTEGSYGSRSTVATGLAVYRIGCRLIDAFRRAAAGYWQAPLDEVGYLSGCIRWRECSLTLAELAAVLPGGETLETSLTVHAEGWAPTFAVHLADVDVDIETGQVDVLRYTAVQDVGTAVHPQSLVGQIQGAVAQGIGWALLEGYLYDEAGRMLNASLANYHLPLSVEIPEIEVALVQTPNPYHPYGVRGAGEIPIIPPPAAIANAIYNATGARLTELPMTPERVLATLTHLSHKGSGANRWPENDHLSPQTG